MKTPTRFIGLRASCPLMTTLLIAVCGKATTPDDARGFGKNHPDGNSSLRDATPLLDRDPARPNEEFFKNVDYVVNRANELGLVMSLVTAKSWHVTELGPCPRCQAVKTK